MRALSPRQRDALDAVAASRVEYGVLYPELERRAALRRGGGRAVGAVPIVSWLIDGYEAYGQQKRTFTSLETHGLVVVRHDLLPTEPVPEVTMTRTSIAGSTSTYVRPAHRRPADPGWRARVELTDKGRAATEA